MNTLPLFEVKAATLAFKSRTLFSDLSLKLNQGEILGLVGPSGSGKSSLGKLMCGLITPNSGSVALRGRALAKLYPTELPVMCWQEAPLFEHLDVSGNVGIGLNIRRIPESPRDLIVARLLKDFGLSSLSDQNVNHLSGGEMARVGLARALAVDPDVLILDEPFASLDVISRDRAIGLIAEFAQRPGKAAMLISHIFADIAAVCREVLVMDRQEPKPQLSLEELIKHPRSAFEAQVSGRWSFVGGEIVRQENQSFICSTVFGEGKVQAAPWIAPNTLKIGKTGVIIANLIPNLPDLINSDFNQPRWLVPE